MREGFHQVIFYPVEGDSAIVELYLGDEQWADVMLDQIDLNAEGHARIANVKVVVLFYPPHGDEQKWWELDLNEVETQLRSAREWLLENEGGRVPLDDDEGLTAAGAAFSKISSENSLWQSGVTETPTEVRNAEASVLREIGKHLTLDQPELLVRLPRHLAERAVAAWERDDMADVENETAEQTRHRHQAGTLALIGCAIQARGRYEGEEALVELTPGEIALAIEAADAG